MYTQSWNGKRTLFVRSYHRVFRLDGLDMQVVLHASWGAVVWYLVLPLDSLSVTRLVLAVLPGRRWPRRKVAALFLGDVGLRAVDRLHVLPERAGICVALRTTGDLAYVGFLQRNIRYWLKLCCRSYLIFLKYCTENCVSLNLCLLKETLAA